MQQRHTRLEEKLKPAISWMSQTNLGKKKTIFTSIGVLSLVTFTSRIFGLVREQVKASILGTTIYSDIFTLAFQFPNLFRRLSAEGAMMSAFIPIFHEIEDKEGQEKALVFARQFFWVLGLVTMFFSCFIIILSPWLLRFYVSWRGKEFDLFVALTQFMFIYIVFISLSALIQGVLNSMSTFWVSSVTPILLNISIIGFAVWGSHYLQNPTYGFTLGVLIGGLCQLFFQIPFAIRKGVILKFSFEFRNPKIRKVGFLMIPTLFGVGIYQINILVSNSIAANLGEGAVSSLTYSNRLLELILGVFVVSVATVVLPQLSRLIVSQKLEEAKQDLLFALKLVSLVTLPVTFGVLFTAKELVRLIYFRGQFDETSLNLTYKALLLHMPGLIFIGWNRIFLAAYYASKNMKTPVYIAGISMFVNLSLALSFSVFLGHFGIALASTLSQLIQMLLLFYWNPLKMSLILNLELFLSFSKHLLASIVLGFSIFFIKLPLSLLIPNLLLRYFCFILIASLVYLLCIEILKVKELKELIHVFRNKR